MRGTITTADLVLHPWVIVRGFGLRVYWRCLLRSVVKRGHATFLECI